MDGSIYSEDGAVARCEVTVVDAPGLCEIGIVRSIIFGGHFLVKGC